jgi:hypothetical protein
MQHEEPRESPGSDGDRSFSTLANLAFIALMVSAFAIMIAGILLGPRTGLVHPEL